VALTPLSSDEVHSYVHHRLAIAGGAGTIVFQPDAMRLVAELSRGLPRRVNVLCDRTLQEGRVVSATTITSDLVKRAAKSLAGAHQAPATTDEPVLVEEEVVTDAIGGDRPQTSRKWQIGAAAAAVALLLAAGGYWYMGSQWLGGVTDLTLPERPSFPVGDIAPIKPIPTDQELELYFREMRWLWTAAGIGGKAPADFELRSSNFDVY
jgi:general secretion pathway protein A